MENILQKVEVTTSHPENLLLIPMPKMNGRLLYKPKLHNAAAVNSELYIKVYSPSTHQTVQIPITPASQAEMLEQTTSWVVSFMSNIGKVIAICVLVLTTIAIGFMCQRNRDLDTSGGLLIE
jgi:hypothetical protein